MMMPPSASWAVTASSTPGVVQSPTLSTSAPQPSRAALDQVAHHFARKTCVAADDDPQAALFALAQKTDVGSGEFHDVERGQIVARRPPIVPRIPEMDLMSVMSELVLHLYKLKEIDGFVLQFEVKILLLCQL